MAKFIEIITNQGFIHFFSTFGLAVVLVLYFIFVRDRAWEKFWRKRYDQLIGNYESLRDNYILLENDLRPESRRCSSEQAARLAELGLDRDLYKLYYYLCEKLDGRRLEDVGVYLAESIRDTNNAWSKFKSPFPRVPRISELYGAYSNNGESLKLQLDGILNEELPNEEKKAKLWNLLFGNTVNMKGEFQEFLQGLGNGKEVKPYHERAKVEEG